MMLQGSSLTSRIGGLIIDALTYMRREPWRAQARMYDGSALRQHTAYDYHPSAALDKFVLLLYLTVCRWPMS